MKPSIVLYKHLPSDLRARLEQHFTVNAFDALPPADHPLLAQAEGLIGLTGRSYNRYRACGPCPPFPWGMTISTWRR